MIEDYYNIFLILVTLFGAVFAAIYYKKGQNPVKKAKKNAEISIFDNLVEYREVEKGTIADILKQKDNQIKSLNARIKQFEPIEQENDQKQVTFEEITALVKQTYPKYSVLLLPMKKQIMEMTKGMSLEQVLDYVKQITGNIQPTTGDPASISQGFDPNYA